ncbi:MAG TPA: TonB-dependent receptor [Alphaproteobacteria bacterium]|nr:TonB-dependent receptor [Alphaproteobacteria bacterium]
MVRLCYKSYLLSLVLTSGLGTVLALHPGLAEADEQAAAQGSAAPDAGKGGGEELQEIVVTGSHIKTAPDAVAVKLSTVDSVAIEQSGVAANTLEVLRKELPMFEGRSNTGVSNANNLNQNTAGGSQVQLRNLDTLILINGRRSSISAIAGIGGKAFVDVNEIPTSAIQRIEVLSDGSSAIYGSDAIGGVVNIITKSNYDGFEIGGRYGGASGDYNEKSAYFTGGTEFDDTPIGDFKFTLSGSTNHTDPLAQSARSFSSPLTGRVTVVPGTISSPASILAAGLNSPSQVNPTGAAARATSLAQLIANGTYLSTTPAGISSTFDISQFQELLLKQDQNAIAGDFTDDIIDKELVAFGDVEYSRNKTFTQFLPIQNTVTVPALAPYNPLTTAFPGVNFVNLSAPRKFFNDQESARLTFGLRGDITDGWNWEVAYVHSENTLQQLQTGLLYKPNLARAIAGGYNAQGVPVAGGAYSLETSGFSETNPFDVVLALDPFARGVNPASIADLYGVERINTASYLNSFDAQLNGEIVKLPAGTVSFAVGAAWRQEGLNGHTDPNGNNTGPTAQRWIGGTFADAFSRSRTIKAGYYEVRVPVTSPDWNVPGFHAFDIIGAERAEKYSDSGFSNVPELRFRWQPVDEQLTIRGSYSKSFTAPTLFALYGPTDTRQVGSGVIQTVFGLVGQQFNGEDGNNPNLKPSHSWTRAISATYKPDYVPGLSLSAEYSSVDQRGFPGGIGFTNILQSVNQAGSASPFAGNLAMGNFPGLPGAVPFTKPGQLAAFLAVPGNSNNLYAIDRFMNLGGLAVRSYNANAQYVLPVEDVGTFTFSTTGTMFVSYKFQALPYQRFYEYAGTATNGGTGVQGTLPKYRFYTTIDWQHEAWDVTLGNTVVSPVTDLGPGGIVFEQSSTLKRISVPAYVTWDLRVQYTGDSIMGYGKGWTLAIGMNNITDAMPPLAPQAFTDNNVDVATYSPVGRLVYVQGSVKF